MKQLTPTNLIAVEVPENAKYRIWVNYAEIPFNSYLVIENNTYNNYHRIGNFKIEYLGEVTKEGIQFDVEPYMEEPSGYIEEGYFGYKDYTLKGWVYCLNNPKESFQSLLKANNIEIPEGNKLLILLKQ